MAKKRPSPASAPRKQLTAAIGLRRITAAEARALGVKASSEFYTSQKAGINPKSLKKEKLVPRRQAEQKAFEASNFYAGKIYPSKKGSKKPTFENIKRYNRSIRGGRSPLDRIQRYAISYGQVRLDMDYEQAVEFETLIRQDPQFRKLYKDATNQSRSKAASSRRVLALDDLGILYDDQVVDYYLA